MKRYSHSAKEVIIMLLQRDPHDIVKCDMDGFNAYTYIKMGDVIWNAYVNLSEEDTAVVDEFCNQYMDALQYDGICLAQERMKDVFLDE